MQKIKNIEVFRFIFALIICYHHMIINWANMYSENSYIRYLREGSYGGYCVDCFFVIAGFFLFFSITKFDDIWDFTIHKIKRLWPLLAFSTLTSFVLVKNAHVSQLIINLLFLQSTTISVYKGLNTAAWFVSALFLVSLFYMGIVKIFQKKYCNYVISLIVFIFTCIFYSGYAKGAVDYQVTPFLTSGMIRGIYGIGLGYLLAEFYLKIRENVKMSIKDNLYLKIIITLAEVLLLGFILWYLISGGNLVVNNFIVLVAFIVLFLLFLFEKGLFSRFLNNNISAFLGKYAFSIYLMQASYNAFARKNFWRGSIFIQEHTLWAILLNMLGYVILGVIVYHLVEKPCSNILNRKKVDNNSKV